MAELRANFPKPFLFVQILGDIPADKSEGRQQNQQLWWPSLSGEKQEQDHTCVWKTFLKEVIMAEIQKFLSS